MHERVEIEEKWDFYPCRVEHLPASMAVNMAYINHVPVLGADHIYWIDFKMPEPGEHGMGNDASFDLLRDIDDRIVESLAQDPLYYVGRLRNAGLWTMYFFGPEGLDAAVDAAAAKACANTQAVPYEFGSKHDADWSIYTDFIYPSPERHRWISDRSVVDTLAEHGDVHDTPRRVDHWIYFASEKDRDMAAATFEAEGFAIESLSDDNKGDWPFGVQIYRDDPTELHHINSVTNLLTELAAKHSGDYDGWETFIIKK